MEIINILIKSPVHFPLFSSNTANHSCPPSLHYQAEDIWSCICIRHLSKVNSFFSLSFCSNCQNGLWCQLPVHIFHKQNTTGESQGLVHIVGDINGSYFTQLKLQLCNGFHVPLCSGPQSPFPLSPEACLLWPFSMDTGLPSPRTSIGCPLPRVLFFDGDMTKTYFLQLISLLRFHQN